MTTKLPSPGEPSYCESVDAWITVELIPREEMENPPRQDLYDEWYEQLDSYKDNKVIRTEGGIPKCTCRTRNGLHAKDCRVHPHRMVILADSKVLQKTKRDEFAVESLFLRPTSWDEELLEVIFSYAKETNKAENELRLEEAPPILENVPETNATAELEQEKIIPEQGGIAKLSTPPASEEDTAIELMAVEETPMVSIQEVEKLQEMLQAAEKKYALVILKDGTMTVENALNSTDPELTFDEESVTWKYKGERVTAGEALYFIKGEQKDFVSIIEADAEQLKMLAVATEFSFKAIFRDLKILKT